ncbi:hypothetical protein AB833_20945 [Chromatiales bacterium (ex Bugula neritina AB1)]|nr:hypothetical protein AB833_20945 [Chromatiales bacterium (ex Bugula neritina AB1)]
MTNNDMLRRLRYTFDLNDSKVISIFALAGKQVTREEISDWLKKPDNAAFKSCNDSTFATFLNGFIVERRGAREGPAAPIEKKLTNNIIFRKLKIALNLQAEEVLSILAAGGSEISKHELSAFFRKTGHKHYRQCKDQVLRNFLYGLQLKYRDEKPDASADGFSWGE